MVRLDSPYSRGAASATSPHEAVSGGVRGVKKSRPLRSGMVFKGQSRDGAKPGRARNGPGTVHSSKFRRVRPPEGLATEPVPVSRRSDSDVSSPIRRRERRTRATPP